MADTIPNKPLNGSELKQIIQADVERLLNMDGMLMEYMSYGKVACVVTVKMLLDNPAFPEHNIKVTVRGGKDRPGIEAPPVKETGMDAIKLGRQRTRTINNPNLERLKHGLPITKDFIDPSDGKQKTQELNYTPESAGISADDANPDNGAVDRELNAMEIDL